MAGTEIKKGKDYWIYFDPDVYCKTYYCNFGDDAPLDGFMPFLLKKTHELFKSGNIRGNRLLDIGTGPVPHSVISGIPFVKEIYLTDYTPANRQYLYNWFNGSGSQNYSELFQFFADLENNSHPWSKISDELKSKMAGIFPVDVTQENIFGDNLFPMFDIITTSLCLESVFSTAEEFESIFKKLAKCLNTGGHLVLICGLNFTYYFVGEQKFFGCGDIPPDRFKKCLTHSGFSVQSYEEKKCANSEDSTVSATLLVMHCVKTF